MERFNARRTFVFMLKKTSFTLGLMLGLAFAVPLFFGRYIGDAADSVCGAFWRHRAVRQMG